MNGIYDDGAAYGPDPRAQISTEPPADPIYDDGSEYGADRVKKEAWTPVGSTAPELRARAIELEGRVPPIAAGPRTDDECMWLEKAAALRREADRLERPGQQAER
ncbi:hypothetical protein ACWD3Z_42895 [Streptomyces sp. NPDC002740]